MIDNQEVMEIANFNPIKASFRKSGHSVPTYVRTSTSGSEICELTSLSVSVAP